ncbi:MAG: cupin domain-containing protein [Hyphomicrobiales bacterium]
MAETSPASIVAREIKARTSTIYPPPYAAPLAGREKRALGDPFGLTQFGVNLTTLQPGAWSSQRHWHEREDEFIYVVDGVIVLIDDAGEHVLTSGMCAGFKAGVPNGHHLVNRSAGPATFVEIGTRSPEERSHYPEADMRGVKKGEKWTITRKDGTAY